MVSHITLTHPPSPNPLFTFLSPQCGGLLGRHPSPTWKTPQVHLVIRHLLGKSNQKLSPRWRGTPALKLSLHVWPHHHSMRRLYLLEIPPTKLYLPKIRGTGNHGDKQMRQRHQLPPKPSRQYGHYIHPLLPTVFYNNNRACCNWAKTTTTKGLKHLNLQENVFCEFQQEKFSAQIKNNSGNRNCSEISTKEIRNRAHFWTLGNSFM